MGQIALKPLTPELTQVSCPGAPKASLPAAGACIRTGTAAQQPIEPLHAERWCTGPPLLKRLRAVLMSAK